MYKSDPNSSVTYYDCTRTADTYKDTDLVQVYMLSSSLSLKR